MLHIFLLLLTVLPLFSSVELNSASAEELLSLDGIGKAKSQKIVSYRETHGCFKSIDELASIEGISKKLVATNREKIVLGVCQMREEQKTTSLSSIKSVLFDGVNMFFVLVILLLAILDVRSGKDFKSQIVSVGVLGTFVGVFIGLQGFDPSDIINSVNDILIGLKTAFFTSIVGMSIATSLSIVEKLRDDSEKR